MRTPMRPIISTDDGRGGVFYLRTAAAWFARSSTVLGKRPSQKMPAMHTQMENLAGAESWMGDRSGASLLQ